VETLKKAGGSGEECQGACALQEARELEQNPVLNCGREVASGMTNEVVNAGGTHCEGWQGWEAVTCATWMTTLVQHCLHFIQLVESLHPFFAPLRRLDDDVGVAVQLLRHRLHERLAAYLHCPETATQHLQNETRSRWSCSLSHTPLRHAPRKTIAYEPFLGISSWSCAFWATGYVKCGLHLAIVGRTWSFLVACRMSELMKISKRKSSYLELLDSLQDVVQGDGVGGGAPPPLHQPVQRAQVQQPAVVLPACEARCKILYFTCECTKLSSSVSPGAMQRAQVQQPAVVLPASEL